MVEMEIEDLLSFASLCGVWNVFPSEKMLFLLKKKPNIRYIAYCLINDESLLIGEKLKELQTLDPSYRIVAIGNKHWYSSQFIDTQNAILLMKDQADIFVRCFFPVEDVQRILLLFCDYVITFSHKKQEIYLKKNRNSTNMIRPLYNH